MLRRLAKLLNPFIWLVNFLSYSAHQESYRHAKRYEPYDFSRDLRYW